ncbi:MULTISPECIES: ABC transporter ATP-binding protein [Arthrobacter]|uniref:ABC transporter ATP-binding protein n=1 Tax=Arthrobacter terricola TaxID=2547396 RepID=A0A4R5KF75_9MICC|nr:MULTISPECIES: ABC transporter ATP-binding protein [Arthrobacter]MBT8162530.1 ABC transporter ATP-binding protein [Arthrobacter sp. GN70]TDF92907.1 ABC transporter ATP-binding protein [Arthrobacter terricola]HKU31746.1 ABC transporter ATP-binding protein [Arthrobacter sp.]
MSVPTAVSDSVAITCRNLRKKFVLRHTRSMKEAIVWLLTGRKGDLSKKFDALKDVSLDVEQGETVALLGLNGSGKSTLLKLISGVLQPDEGTVHTRGRVAGLIEVGAGFHHDLSGRDNVYLNGAILGMSQKQIDAMFDSIVEFAEIGEFIDTEVKFYSSGMYLKLAFSIAVHTDPEVFLIDEILAVGDEPFQRKCIVKINELAAAGKTLFVVSHDLDLVASVCKRGVLLEHGQIIMDGEVHAVVKELRRRSAE